MAEDETSIDSKQAAPEKEPCEMPVPPSAHAPTPERKGRWAANIMLGLLIFACGAVTGGGVVARISWNRVANAMQHPDQIPANAAQRLSRVLKLDEQQSDEVKTILERRFQSISALRQEIVPRVNDELRSVHDEVAAVLRPEQAQRWDRIFKALRPRILATGIKGGVGRPERGQGQ